MLTGVTADPQPGTAGAYQTATRRVDLMASSDHGATWRNIAVPARVVWIEPDPAHAGLLYAATVSGLVKSTNAGASWTAVPPFDAARTSHVRVDPTSSATMYAAAFTDSGQTSSGPIPLQALWKSVDSGSTWSKLMTISGADANLRIDPDHPTTLYLAQAVSGSGVQISRDGGRTWTSPPPRARTDS